MSQPDISIVLPAYNAEKFISRILDEILAQHFTNFEVIIVDDGSIDATGRIIDDYANNNPKHVIAVHQQNRGVSIARNVGMEVAQGKYLCFIDADDEIKPTFLTNLIAAAIENSSDLVIGGYIKFNIGTKKLSQDTFNRSEYQKIIDTRDIGIPFSKLYNSTIIRNHNIRFPENMKLSEDAVFLYRYLLHSGRCSMVNTLDYIYYPPKEDRKYNISVEDELNGLKAMADAIIPLLTAIPLDPNGIERLRKRIVLSISRTIVAILTLPRHERILWYDRLDWQVLMPYIYADTMSRYLLSHKYYRLFDFIRAFRRKILHHPLSAIIR